VSQLKIMELLEQVIPALVNAADMPEGLSDKAVQYALSIIEMRIREGIAQELEELVLASQPFAFHGIPATHEVAMDMLGLQQDVMRGAANCVRGKDPATEDDWGRQTERMKAMAQLKALKDDKAEMMAMPTDADLQRKYDDRQDRLREWND
jgi:hypothetical protein